MAPSWPASSCWRELSFAAPDRVAGSAAMPAALAATAMVSGPGPAGRAQARHGTRRTCRPWRRRSDRRAAATLSGPEDRQLAIDDAQALIFLDQPIDVGIARPAIGAGIVEEFDQGDIAASPRPSRLGERAFRAQRGWRRVTGILRVAQRLDRVVDDVGIGEQPSRTIRSLERGRARRRAATLAAVSAEPMIAAAAGQRRGTP